MQIDIITFAFSLMLNTASIPDAPYNRFGEISFKTKHIEASKVWKRNNGISTQGENLRLAYKTWKGTNTYIEHFRDTGSNINLQTIRVRYWIVGNEVIYKDWFQGEPKYLNWIGFRHVFKRLTVGWDYATDFEPKRFSKSEIELSYLKKLKGNWFLKPEFKRKAIKEGREKKSDWKLLILFEWRKK